MAKPLLKLCGRKPPPGPPKLPPQPHRNQHPKLQKNCKGIGDIWRVSGGSRSFHNPVERKTNKTQPKNNKITSEREPIVKLFLVYILLLSNTDDQGSVDSKDAWSVKNSKGLFACCCCWISHGEARLRRAINSYIKY